MRPLLIVMLGVSSSCAAPAAVGNVATTTIIYTKQSGDDEEFDGFAFSNESQRVVPYYGKFSESVWRSDASSTFKPFERNGIVQNTYLGLSIPLDIRSQNSWQTISNNTCAATKAESDLWFVRCHTKSNLTYYYSESSGIMSFSYDCGDVKCTYRVTGEHGIFDMEFLNNFRAPL